MDDEIWTYYRKEAMEWALKRDQAFRNSQMAYKRGDGLKAKSDSNLGKYFKQQCDEANKSAANAIFIHVNDDRPLTEIDLHGLYVNEAIEKLEARVIYALNNDIKQLDVIVGQGRHSENGPKIKPSVKQFAKENEISYTLHTDNPGCIRFNFERYDNESSHEIIELAHQEPMEINVTPRTVGRFMPQHLRNRETSTSVDCIAVVGAFTVAIVVGYVVVRLMLGL